MKKSMRTFSARGEDFPNEKARWVIVDMEGKALGRAACRIANALRGKDKPTFTAHVDTGAFVIVVNAGKLKLTGKKLDNKIYYNHTGFWGHMRSATARERLARKPEDLITDAVKGMLPKNILSRALLKKLKVYAGPEHPHAAQTPVPLEFV